MTPTAVALLGLVAWTLVLLTMLGLYRSVAVMGGKRTANSFNPAGDDVGSFGRRLTRAHANCYENLPISGAVLLYAIATNQTAITDPLAIAFLGARAAQSLVHLISTSNMMVLIRFVLFIVQIAILIWWLLSLAHMI